MGAVCAAEVEKSTPAPKVEKTVTPPAATKTKATGRIEMEFSGFTSELYDQLSTRLNISRSNGPRKWFLKAGYGLSEFRSYGGGKVYPTNANTYTLDSQYRAEGEKNYRFIYAVAGLRNRTPPEGVYTPRSDFSLLGVGVGKAVLPGLESEFALANITTHNNKTERQVNMVYSLRSKLGITQAMTLDGHAYFVRPFAEGALVESLTNLTYKLTPSLSMRLTYVANNMLKPAMSRTGWDKSVRLSLVFARATK